MINFHLLVNTELGIVSSTVEHSAKVECGLTNVPCVVVVCGGGVGMG